jgi:hypothetical protein
MSGTRRRPLSRRPTVQITPRAVAIFSLMEQARRRRGGKGCRTNAATGLCKTADETCRACAQWWELHSALHAELGQRPWRWPALPLCPFPPNSAQAKAWRPDDPEALALWQALDAAGRAAEQQRTAPVPSPSAAQEPNRA